MVKENTLSGFATPLFSKGDVGAEPGSKRHGRDEADVQKLLTPGFLHSVASSPAS